MPSLSVVMIVKNEQDNLCRLLPTLGFADEIVVCDTGSDDDSVAVARSCGAKVCRFKWCDDFSAARNFALSNASCEYVMWLDADDFLPMPTRNFIADWKHTPASKCADVYFMRYVCGVDKSLYFLRERILRNCSSCRFVGFIHEAIPPFGQTQTTDCEVVHSSNKNHAMRNLEIYRNSLRNGRKFSSRDTYYYARTLAECQLAEDAVALFKKCAVDKKLPICSRVDSLLFLARNQLSCGKTTLAKRTLCRCLSLTAPNPQVCCLFGDIAVSDKNYVLASMWYRLATRSEFCDGFVDTSFSAFIPYMQLAVCLWNIGDKRQAKFYFEQAKAIRPWHPAVKADEKYFAD